MVHEQNDSRVKLDAEQLEREFTLLCRKLFRFQPEPQLIQLYHRANETVFSHTAAQTYEAQQQVLNRVVQSRGDLEALEFAWRLKNKENILTKKIHILAFLIETDRRFYHSFVNHKKRFLQAYVLLGFYTLRSAWKLFKGLGMHMIYGSGR